MTDGGVLPVLKIQRFSVNDGAGIRTTVFLKGCPLRCKWCHNPESQSVKPEFFYTPALCIGCRKCENICENGVHTFISGEHVLLREKCKGCMKCCEGCITDALEKVFDYYTTDELIYEILKDKIFYGKTGGLTVSGGEPLLHGDTTLELLEKAKKATINVAVETCGYFDKKHIPRLASCSDVLLWDIKDTDTNRHRSNTGVSKFPILQNLFETDSLGVKTVLRCIMINGVNTDTEHFDSIAKIYHALKNKIKIEIFSYHHFSETKYVQLGKTYEGKKEWIVHETNLKKIQKYFISKNCKCEIIK